MAVSVRRKQGMDLILSYLRDFKVLKDNPREYWGILTICFLDFAAYFSMTNVTTLFLSRDIGLSDVHAGYVMTALGSLVTIFLLFSGMLADRIGIRKSLYFALGTKVVLALSIGLLALGPNFSGRGILISILFVLLAPAIALVQTVAQAANKRYTSKRSRGAGFNLWYAFVNIGGTAAGLLMDLVRVTFRLANANTWIVLFTVVAAGSAIVLLAILVRNEDQVHGQGEEPDPGEEQGKVKQKPWVLLRSLFSQPPFRKFLVLMTSVLGVRAIFVYVYILFPKYWERTIGGDAQIGKLTAINPTLIVLGLVLFIPLANKFNIFKMLVFGALLSSLSLFTLVAPWQWLGGSMVSSYYALSIACMVVLSLGEVIWSPKIYEYTAAIAPHKQEGLYLGLSMMPWFVAKTVVSFLSGHMLTQWCPEGIGDQIRAGTVTFWRSPEAMWLILGIWAISGPLIALALRRWLTEGTNLQPSYSATGEAATAEAALGEAAIGDKAAAAAAAAAEPAPTSAAERSPGGVASG
ncbi:MAG: MFS transporter [Pseudomonadota bacterium]